MMKKRSAATILFIVGTGAPVSSARSGPGDIFEGRGVGRAPQLGREPPDATYIVAARLA